MDAVHLPKEIAMSVEQGGTIGEMILNKNDIYEGNLSHYFRKVFSAQNATNPYHNFRHMLHVPWLCYQAAMHYRKDGNPSPMTGLEARNLLVAALFHDYGHSGQQGNDDLNIERAVRAFREFVLPKDSAEQTNIETLIRCTQYPYTVPTQGLGLCGSILRDADMAQVFSTAWIQQVVFGLAGEWRIAPLDILKMQEKFLCGLKFHTEWFRSQFPWEVILAKILETRELVDILEGRQQ